MRRKLDPDRPTVEQVKPLVAAYNHYQGKGVSCGLHAMLNDGNVDCSSVKYCIEHSRQFNYGYSVWLGQILLHMSETQRAKLVGLDDEYESAEYQWAVNQVCHYDHD